jgi:hypothetical protein
VTVITDPRDHEWTVPRKQRAKEFHERVQPLQASLCLTQYTILHITGQATRTRVLGTFPWAQQEPAVGLLRPSLACTFPRSRWTGLGAAGGLSSSSVWACDLFGTPIRKFLREAVQIDWGSTSDHSPGLNTRMRLSRDQTPCAYRVPPGSVLMGQNCPRPSGLGYPDPSRLFQGAADPTKTPAGPRWRTFSNKSLKVSVLSPKPPSPFPVNFLPSFSQPCSLLSQTSQTCWGHRAFAQISLSLACPFPGQPQKPPGSFGIFQYPPMGEAITDQ